MEYNAIMIKFQKGTYQIIEEFGRGATSTVYLVTKIDTSSESLEETKMNKLQESNEIDILKMQPEEREHKQSKLKEQISLMQSEQKKNKDQYPPISLPNLDQVKKQVKNTQKQPMYVMKAVFLQSSDQISQKLQQQYQRQLIFLSKIAHPGVITLIDCGITKTNKGKSANIVIQWGPGGTLLRLIDLVHERTHFKNQKDQIMTYYFAQLIKTIQYLQSCGVSHRDIKAQNFVLTEQYKLKMIDFASAEVFDQSKANKIGLTINSTQDQSGYIGSKHYISPEMIRKNKDNFNSLYCSKTDIWSLGILMYFMWTKSFPFKGTNTYFTLDSIKQKEVSLKKIQNQNLKSLLKVMLQKNPEERISIYDIQNHSFFKDTDFERIYDQQPPILKILKTHKEKYFFRGEAMVRIDDESKRRIVGLLSRKIQLTPTYTIMKKINTLESILKKEESLVDNIQIKKNQSDFTAINSEKLTAASQIIQDQTTQTAKKVQKKMFLSIARIDSNSIPKQLQLISDFKAQTHKNSCVLQGLRVGSSQVEQPNEVEVKFRSSEELDQFMAGLSALRQDL